MTRILPNNPNLQHLKNEAKSLVKAHQKKESVVCNTLRLLNRFSRALDPEILDSKLALNEAQYALAMDYGFKSWNDLKKHVENKGLSGKEKGLANFWRKFGTLLGSGVPFMSTLDTLGKEALDKEIKSIVDAIRTGIKAGEGLSETMSKFSDYFSLPVLEMVKEGEEKGNLDEVFKDIAERLERGTIESGKETESVTGKDPAQLLDLIFRDAVQQKASDIHLEWLNEKMRIRLRIDGVLKEIPPPPEKMQKAVISRIKILSGMDTTEKRLPQDGRIIASINGKSVDFRVSIVPNITGESVVIRVLDKSLINLDIEKQHLSKQNLKTLKNWCKKPAGLIVVTGPTGCGKTTTLYSLMQGLNRKEAKICTIENPVEYPLEGINQVQVNPALGLTFTRAMQSQLRQAPNIIMVSEIRDVELAELMIQAALTGHLIFTTLNTMDAPGAIRRLVDLGVKPPLVNNCLIGVIAQRLVRAICQDCKEEYKPEKWVKASIKGLKNIKFFRGKGCGKCNGTGYQGRIVIHELLEIDKKMKNLIARNAPLEEIKKHGRKSGMVTLMEDGINKVKEGLTTLEEVVKATAGI
ncbi:MAG: Flp pilus assembly complex ATPase component TadA [Planctomycetes bacterium]|nr:Flp pilus assembly complex ATPase component TadA [Planctomycetota bacterium]